MSLTSKVIYGGNLRNTLEHVKSGQQIITDAPVDNHGKGEAFSPTDLVASALASCMITVMGIKANAMGFDLPSAEADVQKVMTSAPRRIEKIKIELRLFGVKEEKTRKILEEIAKNCPVAKSLSTELMQEISFKWG